MRHQEQEFNLLQHNKREYSMMIDLEQEHKRKSEISRLRNELEVLQYEEKQKHIDENLLKQKIKRRDELTKGYDQQLIEKQEILEKEKLNDELYRKVLLQVQAEESKLDQLTNQARRRKQIQHYELANCLLEERRQLRAVLKLKTEQENKEIQDFEKFKRKICEEEEKKILLDHAPHLLPYFTKDMLKKIQTL